MFVAETAVCALADAAGPDRWSSGAVEDTATALEVLAGALSGLNWRPTSSWRSLPPSPRSVIVSNTARPQPARAAGRPRGGSGGAEYRPAEGARHPRWLAKRHPPTILVPVHLATWAAYTLTQRPPLCRLGCWWAGFFEGIRAPCPPLQPLEAERMAVDAAARRWRDSR